MFFLRFNGVYALGRVHAYTELALAASHTHRRCARYAHSDAAGVELSRAYDNAHATDILN